MARSALRLAARDGMHVARRSSDKPTKSRWQGEDDVFFHKSQLKIGTELMKFGRIDHGSVWAVTAIYTWAYNLRDEWHYVLATEVKHLYDEIVLVNNATGERHRVRFSALSYSAIWRLV